MSIFKTIIFFTSVVALLTLSGCQSNNSEGEGSAGSSATEPDSNEFSTYTIGSSIGADTDMGLESSKLVLFSVVDDKNQSISSSKLMSMQITSMNPSIGMLEDETGSIETVIKTNYKNNITVKVNSNTRSGLVSLEVKASYRDGNGNDQNLSGIFNIVVLSGPPSAMSLSYAGTEHNEEYAKFIEDWVLTVTDKYNNLVNTNPSVSMGMIAGFAKDSSGAVVNQNGYLFFSPGASGGTLNADSDTFKAQDATFSNVDLDNDVLVTFGEGYTYNASGKWDISTKSSTELGLKDDYTSSDTSALGFVVGHNQRNIVCSDDGSSAVANVYPKDESYIIDDTGSMVINVEHDYYLTGKSTILWVNLVGKNYATDEIVKIGEAKKINLRGVIDGLESEEAKYPIGSSVVTLKIYLKDTGEWYRNAYYSCVIDAGDDVNITIIDSSNRYVSTDCNTGTNGIAYIQMGIQATSAGTVKLSDILTVHEF